LQPNPVGGPPALPQALNRYAATPWGAPGVAEAQIGYKPGVIEKGLFKTILSTITGPTRQRTINAAIQSLLASSIGRSRATGRAFVRVMGEPEAFTGAFANLRLVSSDTYPLPPQGCLGSLCRWLLRRPSAMQMTIQEGLVASETLDNLPKNLGLISSETELVSPGWMRWAPNYTGTFLWGGALSGVVQYLGDYRNPYLTQKQVLVRTGIATVGGGATAIVGAIATAKIGGVLGIEGGLPGIALGAGIGFTLGFIYFGFVQPVVFEWTGQNPQRNLAPLSSP
jgi:hypothetical protein